MTSRRRFTGTLLAAGLSRPLLPQRAPAEDSAVDVTPLPYAGALRNPLKGFTTLGGRVDHEWATGEDYTLN